MSLTIELTEDSLVQSDASSLASIERLRKLGVELAIDDFGKGYSSLTYLKQIPAAEIKIDKRFIGTVAVDETDKQIVKTVIALAHALGMRVVAEGVDSAEAVAAIAELECDMAQGFFIGRPDARRSCSPNGWSTTLRRHDAPRPGRTRVARAKSAPKPLQPRLEYTPAPVRSVHFSC